MRNTLVLLVLVFSTCTSFSVYSETKNTSIPSRIETIDPSEILKGTTCFRIPRARFMDNVIISGSDFERFGIDANSVLFFFESFDELQFSKDYVYIPTKDPDRYKFFVPTGRGRSTDSRTLTYSVDNKLRHSMYGISLSVLTKYPIVIIPTEADRKF